jgi:N-acetylglucosamine kinase-like BadF-type ATPase
VTSGAPAVLAVDGGTSQTDLVLVSPDGAVLAHVRGPGSSPHRLGVDGCFDLLAELRLEALATAGLVPGSRCAVAAVYLAGADLPAEIADLQAALVARDWAEHAYVENDTFALLRTGAQATDAVAVVCGAGINCVGVAADGRQVRFPALGRTSGDWGGGYQLGDEALWYATRAEDGRGQATTLASLVPAHFGLAAPSEVAEAIHFNRLDPARLVELAPVVVRAAAQGDPVARSVVDRLGEEIVIFAETTLRRLDLLDAPSTVVLGGGVLAGGDEALLEDVRARLAVAAPKAEVRVVREPPVLGAVLAGLDVTGAGSEAYERARAALLRD